MKKDIIKSLFLTFRNSFNTHTKKVLPEQITGRNEKEELDTSKTAYFVHELY